MIPPLCAALAVTFMLSIDHGWAQAEEGSAPPAAAGSGATSDAAPTGMRQEVSQYGVTWTFDRPYPTGRFVTGDWWVVGPATVVRVTPAPGAAPDDEPAVDGKSRYGAVALTDDRRMRNGSMIVTDDHLVSAEGRPNPGDQQGYDSRPRNFNPALAAAFPCVLPAQRSLISTISSATIDGKGGLATPFAPGEAGLALCGKTLPLALRTAAVLTCLDRAPPADAFRPAYAGTVKTIYTASGIRWDRLPRLAPVPATPAFPVIARLFERPWIDHAHSWLNQYSMPGQNQPNYGREFARLTSLAGLMLLLDVPEQEKRPLMLGYLQLGIDLAGLAQCGRQWFSDGGHWQGRKWPILFASLVLDRPELRAFPVVEPGQLVYGRLRYQPDPGDAPATTFFQEDVDSYYGRGGDGQHVLWQIGTHTGIKPPYEEKPRASFGEPERFVDGYRANNLGSWVGAALAARFMGAQAVWDHDAFFDLVDRWMDPGEAFDVPRWYPAGCTRTVDPFVEQMWAAHRAQAPAQPGGATPPRAWVWNADQRGGHLVANPPITP